MLLSMQRTPVRKCSDSFVGVLVAGVAWEEKFGDCGHNMVTCNGASCKTSVGHGGNVAEIAKLQMQEHQARKLIVNWFCYFMRTGLIAQHLCIKMSGLGDHVCLLTYLVETGI